MLTTDVKPSQHDVALYENGVILKIYMHYGEDTERYPIQFIYLSGYLGTQIPSKPSMITGKTTAIRCIAVQLRAPLNPSI